MLDFLNILASTIAIITFGFAIYSKYLRFKFANKIDKTVVRFKNKLDVCEFELYFYNGNDNLVLYNATENIFNVNFYELLYDDKTGSFVRGKRLHDFTIRKLVANEKLSIKTTISETMPNFEITYETVSGIKASVGVKYNGKDGLELFQIRYVKNFKSFFYYFFN